MYEFFHICSDFIFIFEPLLIQLGLKWYKEVKPCLETHENGKIKEDPQYKILAKTFYHLASKGR
jgi:hypothetical protein